MKTTIAASLLAAGILLSGCAQFVRDQATDQAKEGNYEAALQILQEGLERYPESAVLRSGLHATRSQAVSRWLGEAAHQRSSGNLEQAEIALKRVLRMEPHNERARAEMVEIRLERQMAGRLADAEKLAIAGRKAEALRALDIVLRELPRQREALAMKRRLEADLRIEHGLGGRVRLADTRTVTLDFRDAPLGAVLDAITRGSGINFILDRDVRQDSRVTVFLRSARLEDTLDLVTTSNQLARRNLDSKTVLIFPNTAEKLREHQEQVVRSFHLANADPKLTAQLLRSMLRLKEVFVDERNSMVVIREAPEIVAMAERLVALHDLSDAEVMLEVDVLEIRSNRLSELGIAMPSGISLTPVAASGGQLTIAGLQDLNSSRIGVSVGNITLNLRREVGDYNILANPRIRAKNREKARILIGDRFPVVSTTTSATTSLISESVSYLDVGLKLDVEPVVSPDDEVTIKLGLEVSAIAGTVRTAGGSLAYQVGTRNANTTLRLRDGETQVLAGLISNDDRTSASRIPGLGDLPIAGRLFSSQKDEFQRTELVLAITPRVLRSAPRPDLSLAELWVGTENSPRLREAPTAQIFSTSGPILAPQSQTSSSVSAPATGSDSEPSQAESARILAKLPSSVKVGEQFTVPLHIESPTTLRGAIVEIEYPSKLLDVVEISEGRFFKQGGSDTNFTQSVNPEIGRMTIGVLRTGLSGAGGEGAFAELGLRAKSAGAIELKVTTLRPVGVGGLAPSARLSSFRISAE